MTIVDLDKLIDIIEDNGLNIIMKLIVSEECYDELTNYSDNFGGKFKTKNNHLFYRDFKIIKDKKKWELIVKKNYTFHNGVKN